MDKDDILTSDVWGKSAIARGRPKPKAATQTNAWTGRWSLGRDTMNFVLCWINQELLNVTCSTKLWRIVGPYESVTLRRGIFGKRSEDLRKPTIVSERLDSLRLPYEVIKRVMRDYWESYLSKSCMANGGITNTGNGRRIRVSVVSNTACQKNAQRKLYNLNVATLFTK